MVYKDIEMKDFCIQATGDEIDTDLIAQLAFYKKETVRLQGELNTNRLKMMANEKMMKTSSNKEKDAMNGVLTLEK
mgnify:CR=1 FL=1